MLQHDSIAELANRDFLAMLHSVGRGPAILGAHAGMSGAENAAGDARLVEVEQERVNVGTGGGEMLLQALLRHRL